MEMQRARKLCRWPNYSCVCIHESVLGHSDRWGGSLVRWDRTVCAPSRWPCKVQQLVETPRDKNASKAGKGGQPAGKMSNRNMVTSKRAPSGASKCGALCSNLQKATQLLTPALPLIRPPPFCICDDCFTRSKRNVPASQVSIGWYISMPERSHKGG